MFLKVDRQIIYRECGMYAQKFNSGIIPENGVDIDKIAYTDNNLYDIICDKIG